MYNISIIICALNEEKNIGFLIQDILNQKYDFDFKNNFVLENITIVSDGSTDKTNKIVKIFQKKDKRIKLIINNNRIGKIYCLENIFKSINSDFIIMFDADVRLKNDTINFLAKPLIKNNYDLIGGNPIPMKTKKLFNLAERSSFFSWLILQEIKKENPNSIYSAHGRILLISKKLYKILNIGESSTPGDDQFIYLMSNHNFYYEKNAIVYYFMPNLIKDYLKQNVRFRKAKLVRINSLFTDDYIKNEFKINKKLSLFIKTFLKHPFLSFIWIFMFGLGYFQFKIIVQNSNDINKIWGEVKSTK